jgi:lysophospholipase L1-like esterase
VDPKTTHTPISGRQVLVLLVVANVAFWLLLEMMAFGTLFVVEPNTPEYDINDTRNWAAQTKGSFLGGLYQWDEHCLWRLQPNYSGGSSEQRFWGKDGLTLNEHGMRSPSVPSQKPKNVRRVMVLGGSHPMGMYVNEDEVYSAVLEGLLVEITGEPWQVLNAAAPGHTSFQGLGYLTHHGLAFEPDIVIHDLGVNDTLPLTPDFPKPDHEVVQPPEWAVDTRSILEYSAVYRLIRRLFRSPSDAEVTGQRVPAEQHSQNLDGVVALAKTHGIQVVLMSQLSVDIGGSGHVQCLFTEEGRKNVVDICALFAAHRDKAKDYFVDPVHANAQGHALIAQAIATNLLEWGWIQRKSP